MSVFFHMYTMISYTWFFSGETEKKTEAVESQAATSTGDLDDKPREHSVTFAAPASPAKHADGPSDDMIGSPICAIRSLCFAQTFITSGRLSFELYLNWTVLFVYCGVCL